MACVQGVSVADCAAINYAATTPQSRLIQLTYTGTPATLEASTTVLPTNLQTTLTGCNTPGCQAIGYEFSTDVPTTAASLSYVTDTSTTSQKSAAVLIKDSVTPQPPVFNDIPGYDFFSTPFERRNLTNGGYIHVEYSGVPDSGNSVYDCADKCNQGSDCAGFNFRQSTGKCTFFPTGPASSTINQATPYEKNEWVKRFDSSEKGVGYRKKPLIKVNVNNTIPSYVNLSGTGIHCHDALACNTVISNVLTIGTLQQFDTSDFSECSGCPGRKYRTTGTSVHTVTNEMDLARTFNTKAAAKDALLYTPNSLASHSVTSFPSGRMVTIKKLDGTTLFSNFNSNVNGTNTVSAGWVNAKNEPRKIFYDPIDYITNGYILLDATTNEHYVPGDGTWTRDLEEKYSAGYTSNVVTII